MNRLDYTWNLLFKHIINDGPKLKDEESYCNIYEDKESDFSIGWWIGTKDFQWVTEHGSNIINYPEGMEELDHMRRYHSNMSDSEFDRFCDVFGFLSNIENYINN